MIEKYIFYIYVKLFDINAVVMEIPSLKLLGLMVTFWIGSILSRESYCLVWGRLLLIPSSLFAPVWVYLFLFGPKIPFLPICCLYSPYLLYLPYLALFTLIGSYLPLISLI